MAMGLKINCFHLQMIKNGFCETVIFYDDHCPNFISSYNWRLFANKHLYTITNRTPAVINPWKNGLTYIPLINSMSLYCHFWQQKECLCWSVTRTELMLTGTDGTRPWRSEGGTLDYWHTVLSSAVMMNGNCYNPFTMLNLGLWLCTTVCVCVLVCRGIYEERQWTNPVKQRAYEGGERTRSIQDIHI